MAEAAHFDCKSEPLSPPSVSARGQLTHNTPVTRSPWGAGRWVRSPAALATLTWLSDAFHLFNGVTMCALPRPRWYAPLATCSATCRDAVQRASIRHVSAWRRRRRSRGKLDYVLNTTARRHVGCAAPRRRVTAQRRQHKRSSPLCGE